MVQSKTYCMENLGSCICVIDTRYRTIGERDRFVRYVVDCIHLGNHRFAGNVMLDPRVRKGKANECIGRIAINICS